jgi:hypothetical protein
VEVKRFSKLTCERDHAVENECTVSFYQMRKERIRFHDNEDKSVGSTCRHSTHDASDFHRVQLADHYLENTKN